MDNEIQKFCPSCRKHRTFKHSFDITFAGSGKVFEYVYKCQICDYKVYVCNDALASSSDINKEGVVK